MSYAIYSTAALRGVLASIRAARAVRGESRRLDEIERRVRETLKARGER